jgi:protocatechuate 3,4-dioxygenase beta subunit
MESPARSAGSSEPAILDRRKALSLFAGAGLLALVGCGSTTKAVSGAVATTSSTSGASSTTAAPTTAASSATALAPVPPETAGPYPGDGSNGPDVLTADGIVRRDIRSSFGSASGVAAGVPLTIALTVMQGDGRTPLAGGAVYVWHCDREGRYSLYSSGVTGENYLRGVQPTASDGTVSFLSIFPAAYSGRWPHIHLEVYPGVTKAASGSGRLVTTQIALPKAACDLVYATAGYSASVRNLAQTSLSTDNVFSDGYDRELGTVTGDVTSGMTVKLALAV